MDRPSCGRDVDRSPGRITQIEIEPTIAVRRQPQINRKARTAEARLRLDDIQRIADDLAAYRGGEVLVVDPGEPEPKPAGTDRPGFPVAAPIQPSEAVGLCVVEQLGLLEGEVDQPCGLVVAPALGGRPPIAMVIVVGAIWLL